MENLKKTGYQFDGWYIDEARTKRINPGGRLPETMTLYDKWTPISYAVTYDLGGGENSAQNPDTVTIESGLIKLYPAHKQGYVFQGWRWKDAMVDYLPNGIHENVTLQAVYSRRPVIEFETYEGARVAPRETDDFGRLGMVRAPMRMGYDFKGWYFDEDMVHPVSTDQVFRSDTKLYARWEEARYGISYDPCGGTFESEPRLFYTADSETWFLPRPKKEGYLFRGWVDSRGRHLNMIMKGMMGHRNLKAVWEEDRPEIHSMHDFLNGISQTFIEPEPDPEPELAASEAAESSKEPDREDLREDPALVYEQPKNRSGIPEQSLSESSDRDLTGADRFERISSEPKPEEPARPKEPVRLKRSQRIRQAAPDRFRNER